MTRAFSEAEAKAIIADHKAQKGAMLPMLHGLQAVFGFIDARVYPWIAEALNVSKAEVHGVVTFYHDFRTAPASHRVVKLCRAEACQANGADELAEKVDHPAIEAVYCLGLCAQGPAALVDGEVIAGLDADRLRRLCHGESVAAMRSEAS